MALRLTDLLPGFQFEEVDDILRVADPLTWARETAQIRLPKTGGTISFEQHPFLPALYRDTHPNIVAIKGAQIGFSTWAIIRDLWLVTTWPMSAIYTMPDSSEVQLHTSTRINPIISSSEYLNDRIFDISNVRVKRFGLRGLSSMPPAWKKNTALRYKHLADTGLSTCYFSGASNPKDAISKDADILIHDEEDKSVPEVIELYRSRISGPSSFKWIMRLSTPTFPGYGIDRAYRMSDMRKWLIRCPFCNADQELQFPDNIEPQTWEEHVAFHDPLEKEGEDCPDCHYRCRECGRHWSDEDRRRGRWVAEIRDRGLPHGYSVSQMAALYVPASAVLKARFDAIFPSQFWNLTMGQAHDDGTASFTRVALVGVPGVDTGRSDPTRPMELTARGAFMGVDVGGDNAPAWVTLDVIEQGVPRTIRMMRTNEFEDLDTLMEQYAVQTCVIDAMPETTMAQRFADRWNRPGLPPRVWLCFYLTAQTAQLTYREADARVMAPRESSLSGTQEELLTRRLIPRYEPGNPDYELWIKHHENSKRVPDLQKGLEREGIITGYRWINIGSDHYFHSGNYARLARLAPRAAAPPTTGIVSLNRAERERRPPPPPPLDARIKRRMG